VLGIEINGASRIGSLHGEGILAVTCNEVLERAYKVAPAPDCRVSENVETLEPAVNAAFVSSPTITHVDMVAFVARANRGGFCEKPIDLHVTRACEWLEVRLCYQLPFIIRFHRRFDPHHRGLRTKVVDAHTGRIEQIRMLVEIPYRPLLKYIRQAGGIFRDMMIRDLHQCCWA
jgi:myo-inositol 2-dehydrogenase/D-chiro-inositol 1-dehydrogenase